MGKNRVLIVGTGVVVGLAALVLTAAGNPANMGFCIACFLRDIAGGLGLHSADKVQYLRPEIVGLVLGAMLAALAGREFRARAGSSPALRFVLGAIVMVGALAFLGCPLRMVIRLGGGDGTAIAGLLGFAAGIGVGVVFLQKGFSLGRAYTAKRADGFVLPGIMVAVLALLLIAPACIKFSQAGPGSKHALWLISLAGGLIVGALAQKSRLCMAGGLRDVFLFRDFHLVSGFIAIFLTVLVGNLVMNGFHPTLAVQPVAHHDYLWSFLGMGLVGWGSVLLGGCPLRQLILAGEGNGDSAVTVLGMLVGAALSHNFGMAGGADAMADGAFVPGGVALPGRIGIGIGLVLLLIISISALHKEDKAK
ncbi:MAG: YedE family putative selenium transporter [Eubacteriales bacterium]|nr:YedE family putative selenium transporter [Eubacteriales bacterium]